ncbi:MAG: indolepyruvate ferredoxin oxidoreductase family protein, partial [Tateyamaria sp.]|nr:indolepyruvate ferredoxin oxidoreductase family protein [Tateyamaria sp.]
DEYEVARMHLLTEAKAREQFDGNFIVKFHLAPPMLSKEDANGRPIKKEYSSSMVRNFRILAKLKILRGTPLDFFGRSLERKMERSLIKQFEADFKQILPMLNEDNRDAIIALAELPLQIKGYGPVKQANEIKAAKRREELLAVIKSARISNIKAAE